jgi:hypothetical protein
VLAGFISSEPPRSPSAPVIAEQDFLLPLTEPSRQMNVSPWQWSTPPFFPLHGVFPACAESMVSADRSPIAKTRRGIERRKAKDAV